MREYAKVSSTFWSGRTGRRLRGDPKAQVLALYLASCSASTMSGIFVLPITTMAFETGLTEDEVRASLERLHVEEFAHYDEDESLVWVRNMVKFQAGPQLEARDNRVSAIARQLAAHRGHPFVKGLLAHYEGAIEGLPKPLGEPLRRASGGASVALKLKKRPGIPREEAPSKPDQDQDQDQDQEQIQDQKQPEGARARAPDPTGTDSVALVPASAGLKPGLAVPGKPDKAAVVRAQIAEVVTHYQAHHPRAFPGGVRMHMTEAQKIKSRLAEGYTVESLKQAIDGYEADPWHRGVNDRNKPFLDLELYMRDSTHVERGIEMHQRPPPPVLSRREQQGALAVQAWIHKSGGER